MRGFARRRRRVCAAQGLKEGKTEGQEEPLQHRSFHAVNKYGCGGGHILQNAQPEFLVCHKQMQETVKRGDGDPISKADLFHGAGTGKIRAQDGKDEPQGIRPVRDDAGREKRVGALAGITEIPGDSDNTGFGRMPVPFHQISSVMGKRAQASPGRAVGAGMVRSQRRINSILKPSFIGDPDIIKLA